MGRFGWLFGLVELVDGWVWRMSWERDGWMHACFSVMVLETLDCLLWILGVDGCLHGCIVCLSCLLDRCLDEITVC